MDNPGFTASRDGWVPAEPVSTPPLVRAEIAVRYWWEKHKDDPAKLIARHLPERVRFFVLINAGLGAMRDTEIVPEVPFTTVLQRFGKPESEWDEAAVPTVNVDEQMVTMPIDLVGKVSFIRFPQPESGLPGLAAHLLRVVETVKRTGGAVEIHGVKIAPCDEFGTTESEGVLHYAVTELAEALRLTVEYIGTETLYPGPGWSWYDALGKHRPDILEPLVAFHEKNHPDYRRPTDGT